MITMGTFAVQVEERERSPAVKFETSLIPRGYTIRTLDHAFHSKHKVSTIAKLPILLTGNRQRAMGESQRV